MKKSFFVLYVLGIFFSFGVMAAEEESARLELWGYRTAVTKENYADQIQLRYYQPFEWFWGWKGMSQLSAAAAQVEGPKFKNENATQWEPGNTRWTLTSTSPNFAPDLNSTLGVKAYIPIDTDPVYNAAQWELGPQVDVGWTPKDMGPLQKVRPLFRYMMGFRDQAKLWHDARNLEFYPTIIFKLPAGFHWSFYETNSLVLNTNNGKKLIPFDTQISYLFTKNITGRIGGTVPLIDDQHKSVWQIYSSVALSF